MINLVTLGEVKREQDSMRVEESTTGMWGEIRFSLYFPASFSLQKPNLPKLKKTVSTLSFALKSRGDTKTGMIFEGPVAKPQTRRSTGVRRQAKSRLLWSHTECWTSCRLRLCCLSLEWIIFVCSVLLLPPVFRAKERLPASKTENVL